MLQRIRACMMLGIALVASTAQAEQGDYSTFEVVLNLISPPGPDNPVRPAETQGTYGLKQNPAGFNDGFRPGRYYEWQTIKLAPSTGAVCGDGSQYKFFVNRVPTTRNTIVYMEGGGACWDYETCAGGRARNPNGIPDNYMSLLNPTTSLVSPLVARLHPFGSVKTQNWNMIYVPYCTGDVYSGDKVALYTDPAGQGAPVVWHHNGLRNVRATLAWLRDHLPRPTQMLSTGCSAGGLGSLTNYSHLRRDLAPTRGFLINDSGPAFDAPLGADARQFPSVRQQTIVRSSWGLDGPFAFLKSNLPAFDQRNAGSLYPALSARYPADRLGHTHFWQDLVFSAFSYEDVFPEIVNAPDEATKEALLHEKWGVDTARLRASLDGLANFGGYFPQFRDLAGSHCTTVVDFENGDVQERGLELRHFIDSVLDGQGAVLDASEASDAADRAKPENPLYRLINEIASL